MKQKRNTRQRQLVLDVLRSYDDHPSAGQVYTDVKVIDKRISRSTVYRNLNALVELGEITQVTGFNDNRFESRKDMHDHFICKICNEVLDLSMPYQRELDDVVNRETGCFIEKHQTIYEGICKNCMMKKG